MRNDEALVTIATFTTEFEASLARGALEAIGVRCFVPGESRGSIQGMYGGLRGSATQLQVFESDRVQALAELRRMQMAIVEREEQSE